MTTAIQLRIEDLKLIKGEPRMLDLRLGEALEFASPIKVRELIRRNQDELAVYGEVIPMVGKTQSDTGGRPGEEFWLNETQALLVAMFSRTAKAAEVRFQILQVYVAYRRGELSQAVQPSISTSARLRQARIAAGFHSASAAAERFGWPPSTYASHENGQTDPVPQRVAVEYAQAFGVSLPWLLTGTDAGELTAANLRETEEELAVLRRENAELRKDRATLAAMLSRAYAH